jgi:DNA processing protein
VLSGLALGIDAAAHLGALAAGAPTIGVLGAGHGQFFPPRNAGLATRMLAEGGAVLSPFEPDQHAWPSQFLDRNGVVAGLADAVVVIEAPARSGALNTAGWAAGSIPVLAVPGDVDRPHVAGCHALIRDGATLTRNPDDVLEAIGLARGGSKAKALLPADPLQQSILEYLAGGDADVDAIVAATGAQTAELIAALSILEIHGAIEGAGAGRYVRA